MPRPKKTTPTVATTEPDTTLNPDRAQVAAVADLPLSAADLIRASLPRDTPPEEVVRVAHFYDELNARGETMPILTGKTFRSVEDLTLYLSQTDRPEVADLPHAHEPAPATVARVMHEIPPGSGGPTLESILAEKDATIAEQSRTISNLPEWARVEQVPTHETCAYCCEDYPKPVSLHHTQEECAAGRAKMFAGKFSDDAPPEIVQARADRLLRDRLVTDLMRQGREKDDAAARVSEAALAGHERYEKTIAEQSARIVELETSHAAAREKNIIAWRHLGNIRQAIADSGCVPATPAIAGTEIDWASMESTEGDGGTLRLVREVLAKVPRTPHDHAAGYLAITSGNVRAARWKRNILHDIRDPDMVIGQVDHLTDGWAPSVKGAAAPPMKTEAEARAWCETRCGWTVVA